MQVTTATRAAIVFAGLHPMTIPIAPPNRRTPATTKSPGPQETSSVNCIAMAGTSNNTPVMTTTTIADLRIAQQLYYRPTIGTLLLTDDLRKASNHPLWTID